jgi:uncharacterized protein YdbL (DUF1318 family)
MKDKIFAVTISLLLVSLLFSAASAFGEDIKARMKARLPIIVELKANGIVGEDFKGYLQFVGQKRQKEDVVNAENADRKKVYAAIAKQQGTTAELVGKRRAIQIAQKAKPGEWLQDANGKWYQKK